MFSLKRIYMFAGFLILIGLLGLIAFTTWYTVDESEQVIVTFGRADEVITEPGLHFKWPWPVLKSGKAFIR